MKPRKTTQRNRVRSTMALPPDVDLNFIDWQPTVGEKEATRRERTRKVKLEWLADQDAKFDAAELEHLRKKCAALQQVVDADRAWLERQKELEGDHAKVKAYYEQEADKEAQAERAALLKRLEKATKKINADNARTERAELLRRGVVRGRRK